LRFGVVIPRDGEFDDLIAAFFGDEKNFYVKSPAFDALVAEKVFGNFGAKAFEAALGVVEVGECEQANEQVEDASLSGGGKRGSCKRTGALLPSSARRMTIIGWSKFGAGNWNGGISFDWGNWEKIRGIRKKLGILGPLGVSEALPGAWKGQFFFRVGSGWLPKRRPKLRIGRFRGYGVWCQKPRFPGTAWLGRFL